jgi:hypothetical protein
MFLDNVAEPPTAEPDDVKNWLRELLEYAVQDKVSAVVDLGGGNTRMPRLKAGPFTASAVQTWLRKMGEEMAPIASWIPE